MTQFGRFIGCAGIVFLLQGCALPRGAALQQEILSPDAEGANEITVVEVTRANIADLASWINASSDHSHGPWPNQRSVGVLGIQPGDTISLMIWDTAANSLLMPPGQKRIDMPNVRVEQSGNVFLPYVGEVHVAGNSPSEARKILTQALSKVSQSAQVQVLPQGGPAHTVSVIGGVVRPGAIHLISQNTRLLSILAQSGGIDKNFEFPIVRLIRDGTSYEIPADHLFATPSHNILVRPRDQIIVVEDTRSFIALGATGRQQLVSFVQPKISALQAMAMIGGLNAQRSNPKGVLILRDYSQAQKQSLNKPKTPTSQMIFTLDLTTADGVFAAGRFDIHPNDTLLATESPVTAVQTVLGLFGSAVGLRNSVR